MGGVVVTRAHDDASRVPGVRVLRNEDGYGRSPCNLKAVVLAGGRGTRLAGTSNGSNKCMFRVAGTPLIDYALDQAVRAGTRRIVIGHRGQDLVDYVGASHRGVRIEYATQAEQKGLVHAIACARDAIGESDFLVLLGDEVLRRCRHYEMIRTFYAEALFAMCGVVVVDDVSQIRKTYSVAVDHDLNILSLAEKPRVVINRLMGTGVCLFRNAMLDYLESTPVNPVRGERELVDFVGCAIADGRRVRAFEIAESYANINTKQDVGIAEAICASGSLS